MNFYQLVKQQYENYKSKEAILCNRCDICPCKTLRNKMFGTFKLRQRCSAEMSALMLVCHKHGYDIGIFETCLCKDCRIASVKIAKVLFREEKKKEVNKI